MEPEIISVVMSVYNERPAWLRAAIESILGQTYRDIEFIIVLDAPDNAELEAIILEYRDADDRIVFLKNEKNLGITGALNRGVEAASGAYIARMDADDISEPFRFERQLRGLRERRLDLIAGNLLYMDEDGTLEREPDDPPAYLGGTDGSWRALLRVYNFVPHPTWLARAEAFRAVGPYHEIPRAEDYEWLCRAAAAGLRMGRVPEAVIRYRRRRGSISLSGPYTQRLVTYAVRREYRRALARGRQLDLPALERAIGRIDLGQDSARYLGALEAYYAAWERVKARRLVSALFTFLRAFLTCPTVARIPFENRRMRRIDRKYKSKGAVA